MKNQSLWKWEKHNVLQFVLKNYTCEFTVKNIFNDVVNYDGMYGYADRRISQHLSELAVEGFLSVRYESVPPQICEYIYSKKHRVGSKTLAIYQVNKNR